MTFMTILALNARFIPSPGVPGYNQGMTPTSPRPPLPKRSVLVRRAQRVYALLLETYGEPAW